MEHNTQEFLGPRAALLVRGGGGVMSVYPTLHSFIATLLMLSD